MISLMARRGDSWTPASSDLNPCDFSCGATEGYIVLLYKPLPANHPETKKKVRLAFSDLPESMSARATYGLRSRNVLKTCEVTFEGKLIRL
jgi:hypothetical protein